MSQTTQNKGSKKVATTTTGSSAATLPSLVSKKNRQFRFLNVNAVSKMMMMMKKNKAVKKKKIQVMQMAILKMASKTMMMAEL